MTARVGRVDHPVAAVRDLAAAGKGLARLGFVVPPIGRHQQWGTANICIMFAGDYLEVRGIGDPNKFLAGLDVFLEKGEGLCGVAFNAASAAESYEQGIASGLGIEPPRDLHRKLVLPDRTLDLRFRTVMLASDLYPGLTHANLCEHLTPQTLRQPGWLDHPNGVTGFARLIGVISDIDAAQETYLRLLGEEQVRREGATLWLDFREGAVIELISPQDAAGRGIALPERGSDYLAAAVLLTSDLGRARELLQANAVGLTNTDHGLKIDPADAFGLQLYLQSAAA